MKTIGPKKLMKIDNRIRKTLGAKSTNDLRTDPKIYKEYQTLIEKSVKGKLTEKTFDKLEDENFHTLNETLCDIGKYSKSLCKEHPFDLDKKFWREVQKRNK